MEYCKLQIGCMIIVLYVACIYIREKQIYQMKRKTCCLRQFWLQGLSVFSLMEQLPILSII